jgi:hypothetical protein
VLFVNIEKRHLFTLPAIFFGRTQYLAAKKKKILSSDETLDLPMRPRKRMTKSLTEKSSVFWIGIKRGE